MLTRTMLSFVLSADAKQFQNTHDHPFGLGNFGGRVGHHLKCNGRMLWQNEHKTLGIVVRIPFKKRCIRIIYSTSRILPEWYHAHRQRHAAPTQTRIRVSPHLMTFVRSPENQVT